MWRKASLSGGERDALERILGHLRHLERTESWCEVGLFEAQAGEADLVPFGYGTPAGEMGIVYVLVAVPEIAMEGPHTVAGGRRKGEEAHLPAGSRYAAYFRTDRRRKCQILNRSGSHYGTMERRSEVRRTTKETDILVSANVDGAGECEVDTGVRFLDHMITSLAKHSMIDLKVSARSLDGIRHHLIEDTAIATGEALDGALGDRRGIVRFGHASVPMDESLGEAAVDLVKRPYHSLSLKLNGRAVEDVPAEDIVHFFQSLLLSLNCCTHLAVRYGENDHHMVEAAVKSLAVALRAAVAADPAQKGVPSTKGAM